MKEMSTKFNILIGEQKKDLLKQMTQKLDDRKGGTKRGINQVKTCENFEVFERNDTYDKKGLKRKKKEKIENSSLDKMVSRKELLERYEKFLVKALPPRNKKLEEMIKMEKMPCKKCYSKDGVKKECRFCESTGMRPLDEKMEIMMSFIDLKIREYLLHPLSVFLGNDDDDEEEEEEEGEEESVEAKIEEASSKKIFFCLNFFCLNFFV
jgi:hypothetical protein